MSQNQLLPQSKKLPPLVLNHQQLSQLQVHQVLKHPQILLVLNHLQTQVVVNLTILRQVNKDLLKINPNHNKMAEINKGLLHQANLQTKAQDKATILNKMDLNKVLLLQEIINLKKDLIQMALINQICLLQEMIQTQVMNQNQKEITVYLLLPKEINLTKTKLMKDLQDKTDQMTLMKLILKLMLLDHSVAQVINAQEKMTHHSFVWMLPKALTKSAPTISKIAVINKSKT